MQCLAIFRWLPQVVLFCVAAAESGAQTFNTLVNFDRTDGAYPELASLVQATDGNFYGTTAYGGVHNNLGTILKLTPEGVLTTLHGLSIAVGIYPEAGLVLAANGNLYGTASAAGANRKGTVFEVTLNGSLTDVLSFAGPDGAVSYGTLVQGIDGSLYGTTSSGGISCPPNGFGCGTIFKITPAGTLINLHDFAGPDGQWPYAGLVQAANGNFYGTTYGGGANGDGTVL
jgi:uncharacterized repeat protein (TIGR03803 family)